MKEGYQCDPSLVPENNLFYVAMLPWPYTYSEIGKFVFNMEEHHQLMKSGKPSLFLDPVLSNSTFRNEIILGGLTLGESLKKISKIKNLEPSIRITLMSVFQSDHDISYVYTPKYKHAVYNGLKGL